MSTNVDTRFRATGGVSMWGWCGAGVVLWWCCGAGAVVLVLWYGGGAVWVLWCWCGVGVVGVWCWCGADMVVVWCWCCGMMGVVWWGCGALGRTFRPHAGEGLFSWSGGASSWLLPHVVLPVCGRNRVHAGRGKHLDTVCSTYALQSSGQDSERKQPASSTHTCSDREDSITKFSAGRDFMDDSTQGSFCCAICHTAEARLRLGTRDAPPICNPSPDSADEWLRGQI